jgi:thiamine biosynthesis protein ThiS
MFALIRAVREEKRDPMSESELERAAEKAAVLVNGVDFALSAPCSVADLLAQLGMQGKRVAVSINRSVIPRSRHFEAPVQAGDRIEILEAVGGG